MAPREEHTGQHSGLEKTSMSMAPTLDNVYFNLSTFNMGLFMVSVRGVVMVVDMCGRC